jgi:hypothetical protein
VPGLRVQYVVQVAVQFDPSFVTDIPEFQYPWRLFVVHSPYPIENREQSEDSRVRYLCKRSFQHFSIAGVHAEIPLAEINDVLVRPTTGRLE